MSIKAKYEAMLGGPGIVADGATVQVYSPWYKVVEISISTGTNGILGAPVGVASHTQLFLEPTAVDELIERLQIAKEMILEKQKETK